MEIVFKQVPDRAGGARRKTVEDHAVRAVEDDVGGVEFVVGVVGDGVGVVGDVGGTVGDDKVEDIEFIKMF